MTQTRNRDGAVSDAMPVGMFRALADPNRIALVAWLAIQRAPKTVSEVVASGCCPTDFSVVSRHLHTLRDAGIVQAERAGREVLYRLDASSLVSTLRKVADVIERCCKR